MRGIRAEIDRRQITAKAFAQLPRQIVVAVDQRRAGEYAVHARSIARVRRQSRSRTGPRHCRCACGTGCCCVNGCCCDTSCCWGCRSRDRRRQRRGQQQTENQAVGALAHETPDVIHARSYRTNARPRAASARGRVVRTKSSLSMTELKHRAEREHDGNREKPLGQSCEEKVFVHDVLRCVGGR